MNPWSNIQVSLHDPEIIKINDLEKRLGKLSASVGKIRELITRFEVCHFKYQAHLANIKDSVINLRTSVDTDKIGRNHIQHGETVVSIDTTGRSIIGQQYVWALKSWLEGKRQRIIPDRSDKIIGNRLNKWLGSKNPEKIRLIRLLIARMTWDWKSLEKLQRGGKFKDIESQAGRIDICHYSFPGNLDILIKEIGHMKAVEEKKFAGCGSYNTRIKAYLEKEFIELNNSIKSLQESRELNKSVLIKTWLFACLAKTIKENTNISKPLTSIMFL